MSLNSSGSGGSPSGSGCGGSSGGGGTSSGSPCGACKFLRRKCVAGCVFAPYFDSEQGAGHFAAVHKIFGASNVSKLLQNIPMHRRLDAVITICYEAQTRIRDPVYGCVGQIFALQQQVMSLQAEITYMQGHLSTAELHQPPPPPPPPPQAAVAPPVFSISDLSSATTAAMPSTYDLSSLFEPLPSWVMQQRAVDPRQYFASGPPTTATGALHAVARELSHRHGPAAPGPPGPSSNASSSLAKFSK